MVSWTKSQIPTPTNDLDKVTNDIYQWGYGLLEDALSEPLLTKTRARLPEQAAVELQFGLGFEDGGPSQKWVDLRDPDGVLRAEVFTSANGGINQRVWLLPNKGEEFLAVLEINEMHEIVSHILGEEFQLSSFSSNIAKPGGLKMDLHIDQWWAPEPTKPCRRNLPVGSMTRKKFDCGLLFSGARYAIAPAACSNVIFMMNDFTDENGGTRLVPGSHMFGLHPDLIKEKDIATVAAEGNSGTAFITDGRVWHGTGANVTKENRIAMLLTFCGPQYRPQVNYPVALDSAILKSASDRQKALFGLKIWRGYGRTGDPNLDFSDPDGQTLVKLTLS